MEVAKIQMRDVARTWWLGEEATLEKLITWDQFSKGFSMKVSSLQQFKRKWKNNLSDYNNGTGLWMNMLLNS